MVSKKVVTRMQAERNVRIPGVVLGRNVNKNGTIFITLKLLVSLLQLKAL